MYANFAADDARQPDVIHTLFFTVARQYADTFTEIYKHTYIHIYKYMFGSNFHGLAPERGLRPDKFINLATLGPSALASRGKILFGEHLFFKVTGSPGHMYSRFHKAINMSKVSVETSQSSRVAWDSNL